MKFLVLILSIAAISCGEPSTTLIEDGDEKKSVNNQEDILEMPEGINWRKEIAVFKFNPEDAVDWNYQTEGVVLLPEDFSDKTEGMKAGDVLVVWDTFIFFVDKVVTSEAGIEISVRKFTLSDAIYGEFDIPLLEEETTEIGNLSTPDITLSKSEFGITAAVGLTGSVSGSLKFPISTTGSFKGKIPKVNANYKCEGKSIHGYCVDYLMAKLTVGFDASMSAKLKYTQRLEYVMSPCTKPSDKFCIPAISAIEKLNKKSKRVPLGSTGLAILPQLEVPRGFIISTSGSGEAGFEAQASARLPLGFEYFNAGVGGRSSAEFAWIPNSRHPATFQKNFTPSLSGTAKGTLHIDAGVGVGFKVVPVVSNSVGISGLGFAAKLNQDLEFDPFKPNNCLSSELYVTVIAKAEIKFFIDSWVGGWEWELMPQAGSQARKDVVVDGAIEVFRKSLAKAGSGSNFCVNAHPAKMLRITKVKDAPAGKADGNGYELDAVVVTRTMGTGIDRKVTTWTAKNATGASNSSEAVGMPNAKTCSEFLSKVAAVANSITLTFGQDFKANDKISIFQYQPGNEIGQTGECDASSAIKVEVGDGSSWNTISKEIHGNGQITVLGQHLQF